jgi:[ribosomal protein S5]-alanine N-acetyltransferase
MAAIVPVLETSRLLLKPAELADAAQIQEIFPQWEIVKFLNAKVPWPYPPDGAMQYLSQLALPAMERGDEWHWTIRLKSVPERMIGFINLCKTSDENRGFWLDPKFQRRGYMKEACDAVTDFWFEELRMPILRSHKAIANEGSRKISERQGMRVAWAGDRTYVGGTFPSEMWEITAEEWRARKRSKS